MHVLFVQYGDFREAFERLSRGGAETYRDQKRSVDFVSSLAGKMRSTVLSLGTEEYSAALAPGLSAVGARPERLRQRDIERAFEEISPTHVVLRTPHLGVIRAANRRNLWLLPSFADIFARTRNPRGALWNLAMRRALTGARAPCVSNHSLNASRSIVTVLKLPPRRVVPWDWSRVPHGGPAKSGVADAQAPTAFFAGLMIETKGVGDCLAAIAELEKQGIRLAMSFAGPGELEPWRARAAALGIADRVSFLGTIPNAEVRREMRRHDFVVVPSRPDYAEGLPNTIYEALASRSVLAISDHPAFAGRLVADRDCLVFPAADPVALAACLKSAIEDRELYRTISANSSAAHDRLYVGMEWTELVSAFFDDAENRTGWVEKNSLEALLGEPA
jgi:glycosyltransferase involved in cell wall biosynthesis